MKKKISVRNKRGAISLFVLLSLLFFLVLVTGVATSFKNKETTVNSQIAKVKASYEKDLGNEEQIYAKKIKEKENELYKELEIDPNGGTWGTNLTAKTTIKQEVGSTFEIEAPTPPKVVLNTDGGNLENEVETISFVKWQLSGSGSLNGNTYTFGESKGTLTATYSKSTITLPNATKSGYNFNGWYDDKNNKVENTESYKPVGTVNLTAHWTEKATKNIILAFIDASGEKKYGEPNPLVLEEGQTSGTVTAPTIGAYTTGWEAQYWTTGEGPDSAQAVTSGGTLNNVSEDDEYYAVYSKPIQVSFNLNGGEGAPSALAGNLKVNSKDLTNIAGASVKLPAVPIRDGYTFGGWYKEEACTNKAGDAEASYLAMQTETLYAKWSADEYTVTFDAGDGATVSPTSKPVTYNENYGELPTPTKTGYEFKGWKIDPAQESFVTSTTKVTQAKNHTLKAIWEINKSKLTIDPAGGKVSVKSSSSAVAEEISTSKPYTQEYNSSLTYETPTKEGTTDTGTKYTVTYNTDGGSTAPSAQHATVTKAIVYTFNGWTKSEGFKGTLNETSKTYTFPADKNNEDTITATYTSNVNSETVEQITLGAAPTKANYDFAGWKSSTDNQVYQAGANYTPTANTTMTAQWTVKKYTVTFDGNGGTPSQETKEVTYNTAIGTLPTASRENYVFKGWFNTSAQSGGTQLQTGTKITADTTYYARWTEAAAKIGDTNYETLTLAVGAVPTTKVETTITLLKNIKEAKITIPNTKNIKFDMGTYKISNNGNNNIFENNGKITITNGLIESDASTNGAINNNDKAEIVMSGGQIIVTGGRQAIYNKGTVTISGTAYLSGKAEKGNTNRATVHNDADASKLIITGGTIISTERGENDSKKESIAVSNNKGTLTIGTEGGGVDTSSPIIQGVSFGVFANNNFSFYDGTIKCKSSGTAISDESKITKKETGYVLGHENETIEGQLYKTAYLAPGSKVTFNANGGSISENSREVENGKKVGTLPETTKTGYIFKGWFTSAEGGEKVNKNTIITENITFYAHWAKVITVTFDPTDGEITEGTKEVEENSAIGEMPEPTRTGYVFKGWFTSDTEGTQIYETTTVGNEDVTYYAHWAKSITVTFDPNGGKIITGTKNVEENSAIGEMPVPTREGYDHDGWFTSASGGDQITEEYIVGNTNVKYYAHWKKITPAEIGDTKYDTLQDAVNAVPEGTQVTINVLHNSTEHVSVDSGKNIILNLQNNEIRNNGESNVIENYGTITIRSGSIDTSKDAKASTINNYAGGTLILEGVNIVATGERQAIYNNGGIVIIRGDSQITSNTTGKVSTTGDSRGTIQNFNGGTVTIESGTISATVAYAIVNSGNATVTLGKKDGTVDASSPIVIGETYGVKNTATLKFYDGTIKGIDGAVEGSVSEEEENAQEIEDEEVIDEKTYETLHLELINAGQNGALNQNNTQSNKLSIPSRVTNALGNFVANNKSRISTIILIITIIIMIVTGIKILFFIKSRKNKK